MPKSIIRFGIIIITYIISIGYIHIIIYFRPEICPLKHLFYQNVIDFSTPKMTDFSTLALNW